MDKLNVAAIEEYSHYYGKRLSDYYFIDNEVITGKDILQFSAIRQVNLLILSNLFTKWQEENRKLKSPYFDYEVPEVKEALEVLMNTLSQHIAVRKADFEPLLFKAIQDTFVVMLHPSQYLKQLLSESGHSYITTSRLKEIVKYLQMNKPLWEKLMDKVDKIGGTATNDQTNQWLDELENQESLEQPDKYIDLFAEKYPIQLKNILASSIIAQPIDLPKIAVTLPDAPISADEPKISEEVQLVDNETSNRNSENHTDGNKDASAEISIHERFLRDQQTLNDRLKKNGQESLLDRHSKTRIENIKNAIPLHQKFVFINELFRGDTSAYHQALNELEQCEDYQSAINLLRENYAKNYGWNMDGEEVEAFFDIIERKFY